MNTEEQIKQNIESAMNQLDTFLKSDTIQSVKKATTSTIQSVSNSISKALAPEPPHTVYSPKKIKRIKKKITDSRNLGVFIAGIGVITSLGSIGDLDGIMVGIAFLVIGGLIWWTQKQKLDRIDRFYLYANALKNNASITIEQLSQLAAQSEETTEMDIRSMISHGFFEQVYFDASHHVVYQNYSAYQKSNLPPTPKEDSPYPEDIQAFIEQMNAYRNQILSLSNQIKDEDIDQECKKMGIILSNIEKYVTQHFDVLPKTNRMMKYYLPTAIKLLGNYKELESGHMQLGTNDTTIQDIERALNQLNEGLVNIYSDMCQDASMDIHADISVLESMLQQDGLKDKISS
ncbi:MAG: hypothetical protein UHB90_00995 [Absicoccus porci]|uniref:hypothetical protein n=1 Tax=Absicoccus porci TaxID=2486576 RepID=UPI002E76AB51|nr:hypothetical protein [Absicoccus porci]MEE1354273.1 hypothetical protein [Absicoccus porci]